jgi:hypothetical protein
MDERFDLHQVPLPHGNRQRIKRALITEIEYPRVS